MNIFFKKILLISIYLLLFIYVLTLDWIPNDQKSTYLKAAYDKQKLIEETNTPRIIFSGGSSLAFGLNTKRVIDETGLNCINLGLHGGLGVDFSLNQLLYSVKKNDVIILSFGADVTIKGSGILLSEVSDLPFVRLSFKDIFEKKKLNYVNNYKYYYEKIRKEYDTKLYHRNGFNELGDHIAHLNYGHIEKEPTVMVVRYSDMIDPLNDFYDEMKKRDVEVYFSYPPIRKSQFLKNKISILKHILELKEKLKIPILGEFESSVYNDSLFWDYEYHMIDAGISKNTSSIINEIIKMKF